MSLSKKNYSALYKLQDKVMETLSGNYRSLYLTGGTALGRFYLDHRYSDDLDFFTNNDPAFKEIVNKIRAVLETKFNFLSDKIILYDQFIRLWVEEKNCELKIEFVDDVAARWGNPVFIRNILIDNPGNILANKLTAIVGRDEPKDVFDIIQLS